MQRKFLAKRFHVETVITSHDPHRPNFSENTAIHESLLICRRRTDSERDRPTRFISLRKMPTFEEADEVIEAINKGESGKWFSLYEQPEARIREGDWRPCQFLDPVLVAAAMEIEERKGLVSLGSRYPLAPDSKEIWKAFKKVNDDQGEYRLFWRRAKDLRYTMEGVPEQAVIDKSKTLAVKYRRQAGHLLLATKFNTTSGKLLAIFSEKPTLGMMWIAAQAEYMSVDEAKALCVWFNSTAGALQFLFRRSGTLGNPSYSLNMLRQLRVPDFKLCDVRVLVKAYDRTKLTSVTPWKNAAADEMRDILDQAVAQTTGLDLEVLRDWRLRLSLEPTICNSPGVFSEV